MGLELIYVGEKYGRWRVLQLHSINLQNVHKYVCLCECGTSKIVRGPSLTYGASKSCGCFSREQTIKRQTTHGLHSHYLYATWSNMMARCYNPKYHCYKDYGGRGIKVCRRWRNFKNFLKDMGERPQGRTLDRIDTNGDYEPDNCRWATGRQQIAGRRKTVYVQIKGINVTFAEAVRRFGAVSYHVAYSRIHIHNWGTVEAILTPPIIDRSAG